MRLRGALRPVGWVERSEPINVASQVMGFERLNPSYVLKIYCFRKIFSMALPFASSSISLSR